MVHTVYCCLQSCPLYELTTPTDSICIYFFTRILSAPITFTKELYTVFIGFALFCTKSLEHYAISIAAPFLN